MRQKTEFVFILSLIQYVFTDKNHVEMNAPFCWDMFYKLIIKHRIWHLIHTALVERDFQSPAFEKLTKRCDKDKLHILNTVGETLRLTKTFNETHIKHCFIKGIVLNEFLYGALFTRTCSDIDVWIDGAHFEKALDVVITLGYQKTLPTYPLTGYKKQYYMTHKHDITFYHPQRKIVLEVHFRLSYFGIEFFTQDSVAYKSIRLCSMLVQTLDDDYHLLYLMIHGAIHAWVRLRWLIDILRYIKSGQCSLTRVMALADDIHCKHIVEQALFLVRDLFAYENECMRQLLQDHENRSLRLAQTAKKFIESDYEFSGSGIFKKEFFTYRLYLAQLAVPGQKFKALWGDLFKINNLFPFVTLPYSLRCLYYLLYPIWICKYILWRK